MDPFRVTICRGPLDSEAAVLDAIDAKLRDAEADVALLTAPVRVVVPSASLREHLLGALVRRRGRAAAGIQIQTVHALAREVLTRRGVVPRGGALLEILAARAARWQGELAGALESFDDASAALAGTVRDLLDAGFGPAHAGAVEERLASDNGAGAARAHAIVRLTAALHPHLETLVAGDHALLAAARDAILTGGTPPTRAILVYGFAEATGLATDFLETLLRSGGELFLDRPPDPAGPDVEDAGAAFADRLQWRLSGPGSQRAFIPPVVRRLVRAANPEDEVVAIARRVRSVLDAGLEPESIIIAARELSCYRLPLRRHLGRLGIPYSGAGETVGGTPVSRRLRALSSVLREGHGVPADRWLDAWRAADGILEYETELRLALRALGAGRLAAVSEIDVESVTPSGFLPLPSRVGLDVDAEREGGSTAPRRRLPRAVLRRAVAAAHRTQEAIARWPAEATAGVHFDRVRELVGLLGWHGNEVAEAAACVARAASTVPETLELHRTEALRILRSELEGAGRAPLGGRGGGVQILTVTEARGRTADQLFLLGVNRDLFPRPASEDPLLPDRIRRRLRDVLPDLPVKGEAHVEERYLFAQVLSSARVVTVSWHESDADGRPAAPSPLIQRLRLHGLDDEPAVTQTSCAATPPAFEQAISAGLGGGHDGLAAVLPTALEEVGLSPRAAAGRMAVLRELDPEPWADGLGPYYGFQSSSPVGPLAVTTLESVAACPWKAFLTRVLHLEPSPDPLEALPGLDPRVVGSTLHKVLETVVRRAEPDEPTAAEPFPVERPEDEAWPAILAEVSTRLSREHGVPHLARPLAARVAAHLQVMRAELWPAGEPLACRGTEVDGAVEVSGTKVTFRADLVEATGDGLLFTDLKTSAPPYDPKRDETRARRLLADVASGRRLQVAAYVLAEPRARGRYVFVGAPGRAFLKRSLEMPRPGLGEVFEATCATIVASLKAGASLPRLLAGDRNQTPAACGYCEVREACLQEDSAARGRLRRWLAREGPEGEAEHAARMVFSLATGGGEEGEAEG